MTPVSSANITKYLFLETSCLFIIYKLKVMELILGKLHMLTYVTLYVNVYWWLYKKKPFVVQLWVMLHSTCKQYA